ncbi:cell wall-binding repeat-containing protein [Microbacterium stercoris]|uniref:Cell wall-binding repeat-containing protein n=1 Tax=Microbacterium stercoris TaxID=2820289 RepID=A0A939TPF3_9MICO|nr:cell wall-binding repeat-containing protein [Microbacterium stercoris]MBO3662026.1 cell wall-binding repeat-containing protein [Microbacterium stercoris]
MRLSPLGRRSSRGLLVAVASVALLTGLLPAPALAAATEPTPAPTATTDAVPTPSAEPTTGPASPAPASPAPEKPAPEAEVPQPQPTAASTDAPLPVAKVPMQRDGHEAGEHTLAEKDRAGDETLDLADPGNTPVPAGGASGSTDGASGARLSLVRPEASIVQAAPVVGFSAGDIVSDHVFTNKASMSEAAIRSFIDGKVAKCQAGYTCLEMYRQNTPTRAADAYCSQYTGGTNEDAARIIYKVAQACNTNPQVLLVMLQKEQGLVTHVWPSDFRFTIAMGMGCPDTAACDKLYYGFFNQVYGAARQMKIYGKSSYFTWYAPGGTRSIGYHPNASCGSSGVYVKNTATAGLYYYTPYQPNAAALAAGFGTGDKCSSYGNRNFYNYFSTWFGSTHQFSTGRIYGADRYATSVQVSRQYAAGPSVAYIASGSDYADALSAAPAAAKLGGPLLLTQPTQLPKVVSDELLRLKPKAIVVVGGTGAVSASVYSALAKIQPNIRRDAGSDRYATSRVVNQKAFPGGSSIAYVATGTDFPDALSASAVAGSVGAPVILVNGKQTTVDAATVSLVSSLKVRQVRIAGGTASVSSGIQTQIAKQATVTRLAGADRYETSAAINGAAYSTAPWVFFATGADFADALSGAALAGKLKRPLLVVRSNCIASKASDQLARWGSSLQTLIGGPTLLGTGVINHTVCR